MSDPTRFSALNDSALRRETKSVLDRARAIIRDYSGLYSDEDLTRDVLCACDEAAASLEANPQLLEARHRIESRCKQLVQVADRFGSRDLSAISGSRALAVAAIDAFQDVVVNLGRAAVQPQGSGLLLKRRARSPSRS